MAEDPSYEELYEENLELLEEKEKLTAKVRELEGASASGRDASRLGEQTTAALQRAQADLAAARLEASDRGRAVDALKKRQEGWDNEKANLEQALSDKDDRLRLALKGTQKLDGHKDAQREERRKQTTTQRELLESAAENESMRAEVSTLTSQLGVLTGALTVAAAERDEILAMRDAADAAHDDAEARFDAATLDVDEAHAQLERAAAEQAALQKKLENFNEASARREAALRSELVEFQDEVQKLRQTTKVGAFTSQLDSSAAALSQERAENERLDAENVELAVLADFLRQRVELLEKGEANSESSEAGKLRDDFAQAETKLAEADSRHTSLEDEIARLEAELADDRELLAMAAERGGMGVAEAVRRNKRMKVLLRDRERQIEKGADRLAVQVEASEFLHASIARFKLVLDGAGDALTALATDADEEALAVECKACADKDFMFDGVELRGDSLSRVAQLEAAHQQVEQQLDDLEEERLRLLKRLRDTAMHVSDKGVRFVGLTQQQLEQVRNFAARLRSSAEEDEAFLAQQTFDNDDFTGGSSMQRRALAKVKAARVQDQLAICRLEERLRGLKRALRKATGGSIEDSLEGDVDADDFEAGDPPELAALLRRELGSLTEALQLGGSRNEPAAQPCEPHLAKMLEVIQAQERNGAELAARLDDARAEVAALRASAVGGGPASPRVRETPSFRGAQPKSPRGEEEDVASFAFAGVTVRAAGYQGAAANRQTGANQTPLHFGHNAGGDTVRSGYTQFGISQTPRTTQGRAHLDRMTRGLKLPDEAWAGELRDAHAALAEALEALSESGQECAEQGAALALLSGRYALARQHVAVLYDEHVQYVEKAQALDVQRLADISRLREQKELAEVEAANSKRLAQVLEEGDSLKLECRDLTRRVTHFEMNEMLLRRRYAIAEESRIGEAQRRIGAERALSELEASLRGRILYLELWKQGASSRVDRLQAELAESVPANLACARNAELEALRDEHVELIRDAASLRAELTRLRDCPRMVVHSKQAEDSAKVARVRAEAELSAVSARLAVYVDKSVSSANPDVKRLVQELAQLRGDKSRLEVEVAIFKEAAGLATARANSATEDSERSRERCQVAEDEARDARDQAADARRNASRALQRLGDAATVEQASVLRAAARAAQDLCSGLKRENFRLAELASIASAQAAAFARQKDEAAADHAAVLERAAALEARSDDDRHIGKLQRELLAVKATYRLFASKYEALRGALRRKEATACKAEAQLDARDEALVALRDERHAQVEALRRALGEISRCVAPAHRARASKAGADALALAHGSAGVRGGRLAAFGDSADDLAQDENSTKWTNALMVDDRVDAARHLGREIFALQNQARGRESELAASEAAREVLEDRASGLELERDAATQLLNDLLAAQGLGATGTGSTSRNLAAGQAAKRILVLSEEVKSVKLQNIVEKRELVSLRDSNRRLQASVAASEDALATADRARVEAEAKALLHVGNAFSPEGGDECFGSKKPLLGVDPRALAALALQLGMGSAELGTGRSIQGTSAALANVRLDEASERANAAHKGALELANDVREARQLASCAKQGEEEALRNAALLARAVDYYERTSGESAQDAVPGLAAAKAFLKQRGVAGGATLSPRTRPAQRDAFDRNDQSRLQAIATQTIASLKALVAEKNRALALAESRLEEGREAFRREAVADRAEIERLTEKVYREHEDAIDQLRGAAATIARADANAGGQEDGGGILSRRLEQVASELREQRHLNGDLERQIAAARAVSERAELRCAEFMREIDLQKSDLVALAAQLHAAEERRLRLVEDKSGRQEVRRLQASLHDKEAKLRGFREALIKLKNEFVSAEESNAVAMVAHKEDTIARDDSALDALRESVQALKAQLKAVRNESKASRTEIESARAERDKLKGQHARLRGEVDALSGTAKEAEGRARELDDALSRARKECRELRANESELRRERRDHVDGAFASATSSAVADLKRELELVQAQNDALRSDAVDAGATQRLARSAGQGPRRATPVAGPMPGAGRALNGSGRTLSEAADDDASTQLESTKLQRRCDGLEKKLVKKEVDLADARAKEKNARDLLDKARLRNESASASKGKERELEDLATTLQRALHRSNLENERLRSGPTESAKMHETQQLSAARRKVDELTEQLQAAQLRGATKAAWAGDAAPTDKVKALQRDLLLRDKEVAALRRARDDACSEKDALAEELDAQSRRMAQLERAVGRPGARGDARGDHAVARGDHAVGALQHEVADLRSELVATRRDASRFADAAAENTHLRSQLATFSDLASGRGHAQSRRDAYYGRTS